MEAGVNNLLMRAFYLLCFLIILVVTFGSAQAADLMEKIA